MREFYIINANGVKLDLNGKYGIFLHNPEGLGYESDLDFMSPTSGFFSLTHKKESQGEISGTLIFLPLYAGALEKPYLSYSRFIHFVEQFEAFEFQYKLDYDTFSSDCVVKSIEKTEIDKYGALRCEFKFSRLTAWYRQSSAKRMIALSQTDVPFTYGSKYNDRRYETSIDTGYYFDFNNEGTMPASILIKQRGTSNNFSIRVQGKKTGTVYGSCIIPVYILNDETLEFCSTYNGSYIHRILSTGEVDDLIDNVDISTSPFIRIPPDEPCRIYATADGMMIPPTIEVTEYFRSV